MMIKIEAIVREEVFEDVKEALNKIEAPGRYIIAALTAGRRKPADKSLHIFQQQCGRNPSGFLPHLENNKIKLT